MDVDERLKTVEEEKLTVPIEVLLKNIEFLWPNIKAPNWQHYLCCHSGALNFKF